MCPSRFWKVFTVASPSIIAATISPFSATGCWRTTTQSPSQIAASIIESPCTCSMNNSPFPVSLRGSGKTSSTSCVARMGAPAAIFPTKGTFTEFSEKNSALFSWGAYLFLVVPKIAVDFFSEMTSGASDATVVVKSEK